MIEFKPVIRKTFVPSNFRVKRAANIFGISKQSQASWTVDPTEARPAAILRQIDSSFSAKETPLNRVLPGPSLYQNFRDYQIAFQNKNEANINSVQSSWTSTFSTFQNRMKCWVGVLSTPTADTPGTTLILHFDAKRYLIGNVAEGTQRVAMQRQLGLSKVSDIFLTGPIKWATTGGLLGMILTLADSSTTRRESEAQDRAKKQKNHKILGAEVEKQWLNIHGGENLTHTLATARRFVFRKGMPVHTREFRTPEDELKEDLAPTWKDDYIQVWAMVLDSDKFNSATKKRSHDDFTSDAADIIRSERGTRTDEEDQNDQLRRGVVSAMFDSEWRLDALFKKKLSEVERPAKIFFRNGEGKIEKYQGPMVGDEPDVPDIDVLVRNPWPGAMIEALPPTTPVDKSVSYIIKNHPQRGKFDPIAARKLGVKPGPHFRQLTLGESVITADGNTVTPDQVLGPGKEGGGFAVIELPDTSYIKAVISRKEWSSKEIMNGVGAVFWILGPGVVNDPELLDFMKAYSSLEHIVSSADTCSNHLAMESPASAAIRLRLLDPDRFPIPTYSNYVHGRTNEKSPAPYEKARVFKIVQLEPKIEVQDDKIVPYLDTKKVINMASSEVQKLADEARKTVTDPEYLERLAQLQHDIPSKDAEVITLGTGSAAPSKYRNVSATLLRVPGLGTYLFDCGENTLGQLKRVLGGDLSAVLRDLKVIWISHLHADHHLGTTSVIRAWNEATKDDESTKNSKLIVASDDGMTNWLKEYADVEDYGYERVEPIAMSSRTQNLLHKFEPEQTRAYGLSSIHACRVEHCNGALAVVFNFPNGFKVAYSGDCRPSRDFVRIGQRATLLIHEATFDDELQGDAYAKKHSTTSEALNVARDMGARRILLTHFSQRYSKIPVMENADGKDQVAIVAFDYMRVKLEDFAKVEAFKPALIKLYEDVGTDDKEE